MPQDTVFVFVGQAGCTIGFALASRVAKLGLAVMGPYVAQPGGPLRFIYCDAEHKVVQKGVSAVPCSADPANVMMGSGGFAGNFARGAGYQSDELLAQILDRIREQAERATSLLSFVVVHSLIGGTGGGFTSRLLSALRQEYPGRFLIAVTVLPFAAGESPLQHYNSVLGLAALQEQADAILLFRNDLLLECVLADKRDASKNRGTDTPVQAGFKDMNKRIVDCLLGVFFPVLGPEGGNASRRCMDAWELVASVTPSPQWKMLEGATCYATSRAASTSVFQLADRALQMLPRYANAQPVSTLSTQFIVRLPDKTIHPDDFAKVARHTKKKIQCCAWNPFSVDIRQDYGPLCTLWPSVTLLANRTSVMAPLQATLEGAQAMHAQGAYLHWFRDQGMDVDTAFPAAFSTVSQVVENYGIAASLDD